MKLFFLKLRNRRLKKAKTERHNVSFQEAKRFGFICDSLKSYQSLQSKLTDITNKGGLTKVLIRAENNKAVASSSKFPLFHKSQLNWFGKYEGTPIKIFEDEPFDYIFYFGKNIDPLVESILLNSKAGCRVGFYNETRSYVFDFMFGYDDKLDKITNINNLFSTLEKVKSQ